MRFIVVMILSAVVMVEGCKTIEGNCGVRRRKWWDLKSIGEEKIVLWALQTKEWWNTTPTPCEWCSTTATAFTCTTPPSCASTSRATRFALWPRCGTPNTVTAWRPTPSTAAAPTPCPFLIPSSRRSRNPSTWSRRHWWAPASPAL